MSNKQRLVGIGWLAAVSLPWSGLMTTALSLQRRPFSVSFSVSVCFNCEDGSKSRESNEWAQEAAKKERTDA